MRSIGRIHLLALAAGGCLCLAASTAGAGTPAIGCGATLTKSTTLRAHTMTLTLAVLEPACHPRGHVAHDDPCLVTTASIASATCLEASA